MPLFRGGMPGIFRRLSATTSVASGSPIPYDTTDWEEQWPDESPLLVPRTGTYLITCFWTRAAQAAAQTVTIALNVPLIETIASVRYPGATAEQRGSLSSLARLEAGQELRVLSTGSSGTAVSYTGPASNKLRVIRVGPERWT